MICRRLRIFRAFCHSLSNLRYATPWPLETLPMNNVRDSDYVETDEASVRKMRLVVKTIVVEKDT